MKSRFSQRSSQIEIMDDLECKGEVVNQTLKELEVINRWLGGNKVTLAGIKHLINKKDLKEISVVDLGCGGGDILKEIADWGRQNKIKLNLTGIDANPNIIDFAKSNTSGYSEVECVVQNIFSEDFNRRKSDIIIATLFTHHFNNEELAALMKNLKRQSSIGVVINDLHRHWLAYYSIKMLTSIFSKSAMVKYDAPLSVLRAFSRKDLLTIMRKTGINDFKLIWKWAFRWQLIIPGSLA